ncbi:Conserved hypothetical protein [Seminavis robusta]|uniref:Integrase catalytic domain-containing protein n=1 Tax=Seminavis robusta TaxID=568900 RepID=A0A9N8EYR1_9STRA|nr:Conserved hypothetical protein [Seminavis robusta]|eukprot:Sro2130_g315840.1 Conserved hypothetical protein (167) ;mRNA; r:9197-10181
MMTLTKERVTIKFDRIFKTSKGLLGAVHAVPKAEIAGVSLEEGKTVDINKLHRILGHATEETIRETAKFYKWKLIGKFTACDACRIANARQKDVAKTTNTKSTVPGERLMFDISSVSAKSYGGNKYWGIVVDDCTDKVWTVLLKKKSDLGSKLVTLIKTLKGLGRW